MGLANNHFIQVEGSNLDEVILNIIRVNSYKTGVLSAYLARRKCYHICKNETGRVDYKEYVEKLLLDNYPGEFKKAEYGKRFLFVLCITIPFLIIGIVLFAVVILNFKYFLRSDYYDPIIFGILFWAISFGGIWILLQQGKRIRSITNE